MKPIITRNSDGLLEISYILDIDSETTRLAVKALQKPAKIKNPDYVYNTIPDPNSEGDVIPDPNNLPEMINNPKPDDEFIAEFIVDRFVKGIEQVNAQIKKVKLMEIESTLNTGL